MRKMIQKLAYKLCSTEVKMLIDKLDDNGTRISLSAYSRELHASHGLLHIVNNGRFALADRIAIASKMNELHRAATKMAIVEAIFEGQGRDAKPYIPGETITQRKTNPSSIITSAGITREALKILEDEMDKSIGKALVKNPTQTAEAMRQKGLL